MRRGLARIYGLTEQDLERAVGRALEARLGDRLGRLDGELHDVWKMLVRTWRRLDVVVGASLEERFAALADPAFQPPLRTDHVDDRFVLLEILERAGAPSRTFLDIGCGKSGGHSDFLASQLGWRGLFVDASAEAVEKVRGRFAGYEGVEVSQTLVTPENVNELAARVGAEIDLLSIDIDSYDYWVWRALDHQPRVVSIEYNAFFGLEPVTVPYGGIPAEGPKGYSGAGLAALARLAGEKGYVLLGCDHEGVNAFFARADLVRSGVPLEAAWRPILSRTDVAETERRSDKVAEKIRRRGLPLERV